MSPSPLPDNCCLQILRRWRCGISRHNHSRRCFCHRRGRLLLLAGCRVNASNSRPLLPLVLPLVCCCPPCRLFLLLFLGGSGFISVHFTLVTRLTVNSAGRMDKDYNITLMTFGAALFAMGIAENFYHHYLLAKLRTGTNKNTKSNKYVAPRGGLFVHVATPHYLFELIRW